LNATHEDGSSSDDNFSIRNSFAKHIGTACGVIDDLNLVPFQRAVAAHGLMIELVYPFGFAGGLSPIHHAHDNSSL
jgi:hypothetical protein